MAKATHTGHCQACGRLQAVNPSTGKLAKHGYTVDFGFFNGTCAGSDHAPLEHDTALNIQIVKQLRDWADGVEAEAKGEITAVPVEVRTDTLDRYGRRLRTVKWMERAEFEATQPRYATFDRAVEQRRVILQRQADHARDKSVELANMRAVIHGQPLIAIAVEAEIKRETFRSYREAEWVVKQQPRISAPML